MKTLHTIHKAINLRLLLFLAMIGVAGSSCRNNDNVGPNNPQGNVSNSVLRIKISSPTNFGAVKSLTPVKETEISNIYVLAFENGKQLAFAEQGTDLQFDGTNYLFTVKLKTSSSVVNDYNLMILANVPQKIADTLDHFLSTSIEYVRESLVLDCEKPIFTDAADLLPMWTETGLIKMGGEVDLGPISMIRSVARIDVGLGTPTQQPDGTYVWDGIEPGGTTPLDFVLKEVYVFRESNMMAYIPNSDNIENNIAVKPSLPSKLLRHTVEDGEKFKYADTKVNPLFCAAEIYVPESDVLVKPDGFYRDTLHAERMAVVIGGEYAKSGKVSYYRLDFAKNKTTKVLDNVLRNHLYQINITKVKGAGTITAEQAYYGDMIEAPIEAQIIDWSDGRVLADSEDAYFLNFDSLAIELPWKAASGYRITYLTNYTGAVAAKSSEDWFTPTMVSMGAVTCDYMENTTSAPRVTKLTVNALGTYKNITLTQKADDTAYDVTLNTASLNYAAGAVSSTNELSYSNTAEYTGTYKSVTTPNRWITITSGNSTTVQFKLTENKSGMERVGEIVVQVGRVTKKCTITQAGI